MPAVTEFAKRTGDFPSLSAADLQVLALTCQLQAETAGPGSVRLQPPDKVRSGLRSGDGLRALLSLALPTGAAQLQPAAPRGHAAPRRLPPACQGMGCDGDKEGAWGVRGMGMWSLGLLCVLQHKRLRKGQQQQHSPNSSTELPDSAEFGSFLFWRPPLPSIEDELQEMLVRLLCLLPCIPAPWRTQHQLPISTENTQHLQQLSGHR